MDFSTILSSLLEIAQKITALLGETDASSIVTIIKDVLAKLDLNAIITALSSITGA